MNPDKLRSPGRQPVAQWHTPTPRPSMELSLSQAAEFLGLPEEKVLELQIPHRDFHFLKTTLTALRDRRRKERP
jgi:hypothetical protein